MNIVDALIVLLALSAILRGKELGFIRQLLSTGGFFAGLLLGAALIEPRIINLAHTPTSRLFVTLLATLGTALLVLTIGEIIGLILKGKLQLRNSLDHVDNGFGALLGGVSLVIMVWLSAAILTTLPYPGLQSAVRNSLIVTTLNQKLPPAPPLVASIGHLIDPNGLPDVFVGSEPAPAQTPAVPPTPEQLSTAIAQDRASVVKVEGRGCGGIVEGSGFVVSDNLVATNAHVVAGIQNPYVIDDNGTHRAAAVWFDPDLDFAVLQVNNLAGHPLVFTTTSTHHGTQGGVLGYPGGGAFQAGTAVVLDEFTAVGRNIYGQRDTQRDVYSISATVVPGNSGGPLVDLNGRVLGVVFATSTTYNGVGYVLTAPEVIKEIHQAQATLQPVSTGDCAE